MPNRSHVHPCLSLLSAAHSYPTWKQPKNFILKSVNKKKKKREDKDDKDASHHSLFVNERQP
jgi:hypothetical protein